MSNMQNEALLESLFEEGLELFDGDEDKAAKFARDRFDELPDPDYKTYKYDTGGGVVDQVAEYLKKLISERKEAFSGKVPKKKKKKPQSFGHGGFVDEESPKAQMDKINISITLNMGKGSEMNPLDDGNQRDIM
tara:strand:- start:196 stop:597 length:402 start_codon:yes stop_codon:yes gene_type:complete